MTDNSVKKDQVDPRRISSAADKYAFMFFFALGAAGLIWLKLQGASQLAVTGWPATMIPLYALFAVITKRFRLRADQIGDNCYYLGLLFTLASLSYALYEFETGIGGAEKIITNFGIALTTTILGLFLRVFLSQFRQDPIDIEREARLELADASSRLRSQLDTMVLEFNTYARGLRQSVEEAMQEVSGKANENLSQTTEQFKNVADEAIMKVEEIFQVHADNAARLHKVSSETVVAFEMVIDRVNKIEVPSDLISSKLTPAVAEIERTARALREHQEADQERIARLERLVEQAVQGAKQLDERLGVLSSHLAELDKLGERIAAIRRSLEGGFDPIEHGLAAHLKSIEELKSAAEARATEATAAFTRALAVQEQALSDFGSKLNRRAEEVLSPLSRITQDQTQELGRFAETLSGTLETLRAHNRELEAELERSRGATIKVHQSLSSMVNLVTEKLSDGASTGAGGEDGHRRSDL